MACLSDAAAQVESIAEVRVHGNHKTATAEILALAALRAGEPADAGRLARAERALRASGRFEQVEVRRRFRSIENPSEILIVIVVDERAPLRPMWLPVVAKRDGHALTYGARVALVDALPRTRLAAPLTWGGERRAAAEVEHVRGAFTIRGAAGVQRTVNPHFDAADERRDVRVQAERAVTPWLRAGGGVRVAHVEFGGPAEWHQAVDVHAVVDTRADPAFPRNAAQLRVAMSRLKAAPTAAAPTAAPVYSMDARGYLGLVGPAVLALRAQAVHAGGPLPRAEWALLGGGDSLRGYRAGHRAGDSMAALSTEIRMPLRSPLATTRVGVRAFVDAGAAWAAGHSIRRQPFGRGIGGGVFASAAGVTGHVDLAWPRDGRPRVHVALGVAY